MPGSFKTQAVVLRSIRFGEADRVLHLYTAARGRIGAIAKGSRKPRSRFGGRLEPFFRLEMVLHEGRGELATVTGVHTVDGYPRLRSSGPALAQLGMGVDGLGGGDRAEFAATLVKDQLGAKEGLEAAAEARARAAHPLGYRADAAALGGVEMEHAIGLAEADRAQHHGLGLERSGHAKTRLPGAADSARCRPDRTDERIGVARL